MKAKLMALILAAGLGITGIAMTTQAAQAVGANTTDTCKHETLNYFESFMSAEYYNGINHMSTYRAGYRCSNSNCHYETLIHKEYRLEPHDYEQTYYRDGSVMSTCLDCKDTYYW